MEEPASAERRARLLDSLARVRHLKDSKLENQKAPAQLLVAIEATLAERADDVTNPTHYFLALESLLNSLDDVQSGVYASSLYLLSIILPCVAPGVVRAKSNALLGAIAQPLAEPHTSPEHANACLRASLGCVECFFASVPVSEQSVFQHEKTWRTVWDLVLSLCIDARPKVRRRAQEVVCSELGRPAWHHKHPYAGRTVAWATSVLSSVTASRGAVPTKTPAPTFDKRQGKAKHAAAAAAARQDHAQGSSSTGIWVCALLKPLVVLIPTTLAEPLVREMLPLTALQNPFLTVAVFEVFEAMFKTTHAPATAPAAGRAGVAQALAGIEPAAQPVSSPAMLKETLTALCHPSTVPSHTDRQTIPAYLHLLASAMVAYARINDGRDAWQLLPTLWNKVLELALSANSDASRASEEVRSAGVNVLLAFVRYCVPDAAIVEAVHGAAPFAAMIASLRDALGKHALRYAHARTAVLQVLEGVLGRLRYAPANAAEALGMGVVEQVAQLRAQKRFDARPSADAVIGAAIEAIGPRTVLHALPLNLLGADRRPNTKGDGRAWLLPLLREHITNAELGYFATELVPMSEALFELRVAALQDKPVEAKVFEALIEQLWGCFPSFCELPRDLTRAMTPQFLELLLNVLRSQAALRAPVLKGLQNLVTRTQSLQASMAPAAQLQAQFGVDQATGKQDMAHLQAMSGTLLAALFNLLAEMPAQSRGYVLDCISTYFGILDEASIAQTCEKIAAMLQQALATYKPAVHSGAPEANSPRYVPPIPHTMLDLLLALVPFVNAENACRLFDLVDDALLAAPDGGVQKKTYRLLARLLGTEHGPGLLHRAGSTQRGAAALMHRLALLTDSVESGAVRDRLQMLGAVVPFVGTEDLHILSALVPETVLGTKEANQGAREVAYALLVQIGHRMHAGGTLDRGKAQPDAPHTEIVQASANEFTMMVAAGLAGGSPRMISASITALARLLYEFHASLPAETLDELLGTMIVYLDSTNREIIKSALGFVKVAIVVLDAARVEKSLAELVPALVGVRVEHKNQFKGRVRHMLERLMRRFGLAAVEAHVDEENKRLITNIRKRKERAKKRAAGADDDTKAQPFQKPGAGSMDAFEEALYGSASESESDEEEPRPKAKAQGRRRHREGETYLVEDNDQPMDLLDPSAMSAVRAKPERKPRRNPGEEASRFAVEDDGRIRFQDAPQETDAAAPLLDDKLAGAAYLEKGMGVDGFTHSRGGAVKFNKNNKRTRANERADEEDEEMVPAQQGKHARTKKQQVGNEFRAKRAAGDVRKGGVSPYAYVPLSSVTGKKNAKHAKSLQIAGKRA
ncbi:pre-rRNA processing protein [Malassezia vespertilionis]|uniref:Uncharacterized protein n=1 Tax=Malassezia vespertilionis TaxID=2020962 RepID=A0A2N1JEL6_9BASI|nr:pre-rRNA processing protein [Malassezia vespertilionis]PKI84975.1 hypothetical protein MVES_001247 [Malassezia vespertilionis]WFD05991.1 pre-rRNA processing protein [Malassezia vespertilionis]